MQNIALLIIFTQHVCIKRWWHYIVYWFNTQHIISYFTIKIRKRWDKVCASLEKNSRILVSNVFHIAIYSKSNVFILCDMVKHELRVTSWKLKSTSWKFKSTSWNSKVLVRIKSTSYEFETTSYEFESTSYEFESTSYEFESTRSNH